MKFPILPGCALMLAVTLPLAATQTAFAQTGAKAENPMAAMGMAQEIRIGDLVLSQGWARATPKGAPTGAGYVTITNHGAKADRLVGVATPIAERAEIHTMSMTDEVMKMRKLEDGVEIPAGETVVLKPGSFHLMFIGLAGPVSKGSKVAATLTFERAGKVTLELPAAPVGSRKPMGNMGNMGQSGKGKQ